MARGRIGAHGSWPPFYGMSDLPHNKWWLDQSSAGNGDVQIRVPSARWSRGITQSSTSSADLKMLEHAQRKRDKGMLPVPHV